MKNQKGIIGSIVGVIGGGLTDWQGIWAIWLLLEGSPDTWDYFKENPELKNGSSYRKVIAGALRKVALAEEGAGKALEEAGGKFKTF